MPSLKDLRNRIASVKATQKITKAMQMVAAAKLRRAQTAAEAARPYAERMDAGARSTRRRDRRRHASAPQLLAGTGRDDVHLLVVCTAERGLCGGFNSSIARLAREHAQALLAEGKTVKIICVGKKGYDILRRQFAREIIEFIDLRGVKQLGFDNADAIARKIVALFEGGEFDVCTVFFARFNSVISQIPTALRLIPPSVGGEDAAARPQASTNYEPDEEEILADAAAAQCRRCRFCARCSKTPPPNRARA